MLSEKLLAERAGGKSLATDLFERALKQQREGAIRFAAGGNDNFLAAQKAYAGAKDDFKRAREQIEFSAIAKDNAEIARREMLEAKQRVPGREEDRLANTRYALAMQVEVAGNSQFQVGDFVAAQSSFMQARGGYLEAATTMIKSTSASVADAARAEEFIGKRKFRFKGKLHSLDATVIDLYLSMLDWAHFSQTQNVSMTCAVSKFGVQSMSV